MMAVAVNNWFRQRYKFEAPPDWLEACIEWIKEENEGVNLSIQQLSQHVLEQWLLCDLTEAGACSLPEGLSEQVRFTLNGTFCLQINSVRDVSSPYYSQLQKIQGTENENVNVTATPYTQTQQIKAGRMLMFEMTDGLQSIRGMEYTPIPGVGVDLMPGVKVVISGSIVCRRGVLMLTKENWTLLGGEVESLAENTQVKILQQALAEQSGNLQNPQWDRGSTRKVFESKPIKVEPKSQNPTSRAALLQNQTSSTRTQVFKREQNDDDFLDNLDPDELDALEQHWKEEDIDTHQNRIPLQTTINSLSKRPVLGNTSLVPKNTKMENCHIMNISNELMWDDDDDDGDLALSAIPLNSRPSSPLMSRDRTPIRSNSGGKPAWHGFDEDFDDEFDELLSEPSMKKQCVKSFEYNLASSPYTYLKLIQDGFPPSDDCLVIVKAYVSTLSSRLEHNNGKFWSLFVKLNDGSASMDVDLADNFLCDLIGFTAWECHAMKEQAQVDRKIKVKIVQGMKQCQSRLVELTGLLHLQLFCDKPRPVVIHCTHFTRDEATLLKNRLND